MHLYLTKRSHLNTSYVNDIGQVVYKVETPNNFFRKATTIKRIVPWIIHHSSSRSDATLYDAVNDNEEIPNKLHDDESDDIHEKFDDEFALKDRFSHLAEIRFNVFSSSVLLFGGQEYETERFFTKKEMMYRVRNCAFTGFDGLEYKWIMRFRITELVRIDSAKTKIARFHRRCGFFEKRRPASLEIFSAGKHMIDLILITFVYVEKIRYDKEGAAHYYGY